LQDTKNLPILGFFGLKIYHLATLKRARGGSRMGGKEITGKECCSIVSLALRGCCQILLGTTYQIAKMVYYINDHKIYQKAIKYT
jgi:hypothetical protein